MIEPIPDVAIVDETEPYPGRIRVAFRDGSVQTYHLDVQQPSPLVVEMNELARQMKERLETFGGYKYKEKGKGKRRDRK